MITQEMLQADAALQGLSEEQVNAIVTMSKNDEDVVIGNRFREVYTRLDETIAKTTGVQRNGDEKTYNYLERAAGILAEKANSVDGLNSKISDLTKEKERLTKALAEGGDDTIKKQLAQANKDIEAMRSQYDTLKADYDKQKEAHTAELFGIKIDNVLAAAQAGLQFKKEFPQQAIDTLLANAIAKVKGMSPEFISDGNNGERLVFRDKDGKTLQNAENHLEPYTAAELLAKELNDMGILDTGRKQQGGGTNPNEQQGGGVVANVSMARTQSEADEIIHKQLSAQGLLRGSKAYQEAYNQAWVDNNINKLPQR